MAAGMKDRKIATVRAKRAGWIECESAWTPDEIRGRIEVEVRREAFELIGIHDVSEEYLRRGHPLTRSILVAEFSSPGLAREAFDRSPQLALLGPSRIAIYSKNGGTTVVAMLPSLWMRIVPPSWLTAATLRRYRGVVREYDARVRQVVRRLARGAESRNRRAKG